MREAFMKLSSKVKLLLCMFFYWTNSLALPEDSKQVVHLEAGTADLNQQTHRGVFTDNVNLVQGSTHLSAAQVITVGNIKNQLIEAILKGNITMQAHYWTLTTPNKPSVHAYADTIYYYPEKHRIKLVGHARVEQDKNSLSAAVIIYDTEQQHVITQSEGTTRTTIIIYPENKHL